MSNPTRYAEKTKVTVEKSQFEIKSLLSKHGATSFGMMETLETSTLVCEYKGRRLKFEIKRHKEMQEYMRQWRVMLLRIKARIEEVTSKEVTVDEAFMPYIMLPNGLTVAETILPAIADTYKTGSMPQLLLGFQK